MWHLNHAECIFFMGGLVLTIILIPYGKWVYVGFGYLGLFVVVHTGMRLMPQFRRFLRSVRRR